MAKSKLCKYCNLPGHSTLQCFARPKNRIITSKKMRQIGKGGQKWLRLRAEWISQNPGPWYCFYCGELLTLAEMELDHKESRSRRPDLRYEVSNLVPACHRDNSAKGSRSADEYLASINVSLI